MDFLNHENQTDVIEAFDSTSRYLDDPLNIDSLYFEDTVNKIYTPEPQLNEANTKDTEAPFLFTSTLCKCLKLQYIYLAIVAGLKRVTDEGSIQIA